MKTYKLRFEETVQHEHEIVVETKLSIDELDGLLDLIDFSDSNLEEGITLLEGTRIVNIKKIIENDPYNWGMECTDIDELEE